MPQISTTLSEGNDMLRLFIYGPGKSKKTWWALRAAEAGFRVLLFSLERGHGIARQLSQEAQKRIYLLEAHDAPEDGYAARFTVEAFKTFNFYADEQQRRVTSRPASGLRHYDMRGFGRDTVIVIDTYTALAISTARTFSFENKIDLSDADKQEWPGYGYCGRLLTFLLTQFRSAPCHIIIIGHATQYDFYKKLKGIANKDKRGPLEFSRRQPMSSSNPHGMSISRDFDNVFYMYGEGRSFYLDSRGNKDEDAGSRIIAPDRYDWETMTFGELAMHANIPHPTDVAPFDFQIVEGAPVMGNRPIVAKKPIAQTRTSILTNIGSKP